jgi:hypothetical protein
VKNSQKVAGIGLVVISIIIVILTGMSDGNRQRTALLVSAQVFGLGLVLVGTSRPHRDQ